MSTQQQLIEDAFANFGILDEETGLEPTQLRRGLRELHRLVNRLYDEGIAMAYYLSDNLSDDTGVGDTEEETLIASLALKLSSTYANDRQPSITLANTAKNTARTLRAKKSVKPVRVYPSTFPRGAGNTTTLNARSTFYTNQGRYRVVLSNNDAVTYNGNPIYFDNETFA